MSPPQPSTPAEFRLYRRIVSGLVLAFVSLGSAYLLVSVGVSIYRRRNVVPPQQAVTAAMTTTEIRACHEDLDDIGQSLQKHLENFHHLLGGYDSAQAQRWAEEGSVWRRQWKVLGKRCPFRAPRGSPHRKELDELAAVYAELADIEQVYSNQLLRFGKHQVPRLDRVRQRLDKIGERLAKEGPPPGENTP